LKQIKNSCYEQILRKFNQEKHNKVKDRNLIEFTCDKFANYKTAFMKLFGRVCKLNFGILIAYKKHGVKHNNNAIERYNGKTKDRIKNIRSGFKSFGDAINFMSLMGVIHNFVNANQELQEKTPAEVAGINLKLGRNRLLSLIRYVARNRGISR
jgi:transposase-like protein